ncbi:MAG: UvrD-helicase domain-containing protein [Planctomycetota bacterium]
MTHAPRHHRAFDLTEYPLPSGTIVEASAGTGKTYSVAAYVTHALAADDTLRIGNILVTTYTRNAAAELRDRIRGRLLATARLLRSDATEGRDPLDARLLAADSDTRLAMARRLERAVAEFDTATIGTIHSICARVLRMAGIEPGDAGDEDLLARTVAEVVNDAVVTEAAAGRGWDEDRLTALVTAALGDPFIVPWFDPAGRGPEEREWLERAVSLVQACIARVQAAMRATPSFDDLLRLAWEEVRRPERTGLVAELRRRFRLAIVDEAQDTSRLQWEFFHELFPLAPQPGGGAGDDGRRLVAVGDPKQAIYGFRGADITAYLRFAEGDGGGRPRRSLSTNYRSDGPLLESLNVALAGASFGPGIEYQPVAPAEHRGESRLVDLPPVEFIGLDDAWATDAAVRKVFELLERGRFVAAVTAGGEQPHLPIKPRDICVLVRVNAIGKAIEGRLARLGIPAVSTGTASVMEGQLADDLRVLFEAMERPGSGSRVRRAAATVFFGHPLTAVGRLGEQAEQAVQERIAELHAVLQARGIAAVRAAIMGDVTLAGRLAAGPDGERHVVDLAHLVELLHDASRGRGCHARLMLEHMTELARRDEKSDLVSRRVESDEDAVRIMSVHVAKGLEFPCVVVVDDWKEKSRPPRGPAVFYRGTERRLDVAYALTGSASPPATAAVLAADNEELRRLLYVAMTRPRHHLCVIRRTDGEAGVIDAVLTNPPPLRPAADLPPLPPRWRLAPQVPAAAPGVAALPPEVKQTTLRTSFSGIVAAATRGRASDHAPPGHGHDELGSDHVEGPAPSSQRGAGLQPAHAPMELPALASFAIPDLPAGTAFGSAVHEIFERLDIDPAADAAARATTVARVVGDVATATILRPHHEPLARMIAAAIETPFGGPAAAPFRDLRFADFAPSDRLAELDFEMGLAGLTAGVMASDVGRVLAASLPAGDRLADYARALAGPAFDIPLAGLINGSIDAVLRLPGRPVDDPLLVIADYKTNRLHGRTDPVPLAAYAPSRLVEAMHAHHYPLQALVYGTAVYRLLRWRLGPVKPTGWDPGGCIAGVVYGFTRGMHGPETPVDDAGHRYGVFAWVPPATIWRQLSDLFAGKGKVTETCPP